MFLEYLYSETDQEIHENYINDFSQKVFIRGKLAILDLKMTRPCLDIERGQKIHESFINRFSYKIAFLSSKKGGTVKIPNYIQYIKRVYGLCHLWRKTLPWRFQVTCLCYIVYSIYIYTYLYIQGLKVISVLILEVVLQLWFSWKVSINKFAVCMCVCICGYMYICMLMWVCVCLYIKRIRFSQLIH